MFLVKWRCTSLYWSIRRNTMQTTFPSMPRNMVDKICNYKDAAACVLLALLNSCEDLRSSIFTRTQSWSYTQCV